MSDLFLYNIGHLTTNDGDPITNAVVVIENGFFTYVGDAANAPAMGDLAEFDCMGMAVIPGFVDAHTHLAFAGDRADEFARKMAGEDYKAIARDGGGIMSTVRATRAAPKREIISESTMRLVRMFELGTTAVEVKSGYGLNVEDELKLLRAIRYIEREMELPIRKTFLGAHAIPPEYTDNRQGYVDLVIGMLPKVSEYADDCDVFVEDVAFTVDEARAILTRAKELGMGLRVHAEQLSHSGGAMLAAELGAMSADHLDHATPEDAAALAAAGVAAVLTPGASYMLRTPQAPGPMLWEAGCTVAIATDCNPGTSYFEGMPLVISLAVVQMGLTVDQAIWAATRGGALALGMDDHGLVKSGSPGDLVVIDAPSPAHLAYRPAASLVHSSIGAGFVLHSVE